MIVLNVIIVKCGLDFKDFTVDHVVPCCYGGKDNEWNLVACCYNCNQLKATKSYESFAGRPFIIRLA